MSEPTPEGSDGPTPSGESPEETAALGAHAADAVGSERKPFIVIKGLVKRYPGRGRTRSRRRRHRPRRDRRAAREERGRQEHVDQDPRGRGAARRGRAHRRRGARPPPRPTRRDEAWLRIRAPGTHRRAEPDGGREHRARARVSEGRRHIREAACPAPEVGRRARAPGSEHRSESQARHALDRRPSHGRDRQRARHQRPPARARRTDRLAHGGRDRAPARRAPEAPRRRCGRPLRHPSAPGGLRPHRRRRGHARRQDGLRGADRRGRAEPADRAHHRQQSGGHGRALEPAGDGDRARGDPPGREPGPARRRRGRELLGPRRRHPRHRGSRRCRAHGARPDDLRRRPRHVGPGDRRGPPRAHPRPP